MPAEDPPDLTDRAREEFFAETHELVEQLARDLLDLDDRFKRGRSDPETLNNVFRGVHTLKGLAGLFGVTALSRVTHRLEDLLDQLRLERIPLNQAVLDDLLRAVEYLGLLLEQARAGVSVADADLERFLQEIYPAPPPTPSDAAAPPAPPAPPGEYDLDPSVFAVLTEYEEHRLRANLARGVPLYRIRVRYPLATIDRGLDELRARARTLGEIITYLPTGVGDGETLEIDVLLASEAPFEQLCASLGGAHRSVIPVARRAVPPAVQVPPPGDGARRRGASRPSRAPRAFPPGVPPGTPPGVPPAVPNALAAPGDDDLGVRGARAVHSVRVDIRRLDHLMNLLGDLSLVRSALAGVTERARTPGDARALRGDLQRLYRDFDRNLHDLQRGVLEVRMVPLGQVFERLAREVRKLSRELSKEIRLVVTGVETEVDKLIVEELGPPLLHLVRNAIDHGIEAPAERARRDKPLEGTIAINAYQAGSMVAIEVEDDGAGIDPAVVGAAAMRRGMVTEAALRAMDPREVLGLVLAPGFTTRDRVTETSGRGVGLDVVKTNIARLGGVVDLATEVGVYTKVTVTLPVTLAIFPALIVGVAGRRYALPLSSVAEALRAAPDAVRWIDGREVLTRQGRTLPLCRLGVLFGHEPPTPASAASFVVVVALGGQQLGFLVDELVGQQDIVIKALGPSLRQVRGISGATDLGEQRVGLVLDLVALVDETLGERRASLPPPPALPPARPGTLPALEPGDGRRTA